MSYGVKNETRVQSNGDEHVFKKLQSNGDEHVCKKCRMMETNMYLKRQQCRAVGMETYFLKKQSRAMKKSRYEKLWSFGHYSAEPGLTRILVVEACTPSLPY